LNKTTKRLDSARKSFDVKQSLIYLVSHFSSDEGDFIFEDDFLTRDQWETVFSESIYNEEVCVFREDEEELMLIIKKPTIQLRNHTKNYTADFFPVSALDVGEIAPEDITYKDMVEWIYGTNTDWTDRALEYLESFQAFDDIENHLKKSSRKRYIVANKYEDVRSFNKEVDRHREFPCNFHSFFAKFSKYDVRRVRSLQIQLVFPKTGLRRTFIYTFDEFLDLFQQDENLCEDALVESMKNFYSDSRNFSSYFRVLTIDTSQCKRQKHKDELSVKVKIGNADGLITFPHVEDSHFEDNKEFVRVKVQDYTPLFGEICGTQTNILQKLEDYIPKIDWRKKLGRMYFPY
jgi:hypothetical protein